MSVDPVTAPVYRQSFGKALENALFGVAFIGLRGYVDKSNKLPRRHARVHAATILFFDFGSATFPR